MHRTDEIAALLRESILAFLRLYAQPYSDSISESMNTNRNYFLHSFFCCDFVREILHRSGLSGNIPAQLWDED